MYFGFEGEMFRTKVYQGAVRSLLLQSVRVGPLGIENNPLRNTMLKGETINPKIAEHERVKIHRIVHPLSSSDPAFLENCLHNYSRLHGDEKDSW
jgi:hypothetical protein